VESSAFSELRDSHRLHVLDRRAFQEEVCIIAVTYPMSGGVDSDIHRLFPLRRGSVAPRLLKMSPQVLSALNL
jgi:hypothetical protein